MAGKINYLIEGTVPTLLHTEKGNELIRAINAMQNLSIEKGEIDQVIYSGDQIKIIYDPRLTGWEEKEITICEDGEEVAVTMLVKVSSE